MTEPIPGPTPLPVIENLRDIDLANGIQSFVNLAAEYGPIYKLRLGGGDRIFISGHELANKLLSRKDFVKYPAGAVRHLRDVLRDGLFTADHGEEAWGVAHRILMPALGPLLIRNISNVGGMPDIISELVLKWARFGDDEPIDVTADFTRPTLDTISLCAMDLRLNSFYKDKVHPLVDAMLGVLVEASCRSGRPSWFSWFTPNVNKKFDSDNKIPQEIAAEVISKCRDRLVDALLNGRDPLTGSSLTDANVINMITFLIAGHETTSSLLSFLLALLLTNPEAYKKVQLEVDTVLRQGPMAPDHIARLPYIKACLREALRLYPPVPGFSVAPKDANTSQPVVLGGEYAITPEQAIFILTPKLHREPTAFGDDVDEFKPERMLEENFQKLPNGCYKPFGNGSRACIGSEFALQEAIMTTAILFQKFEFKLVDPDYKLTVLQTLTLKPRNLQIYARPRPGIAVLTLQRDLRHPPRESLARATTGNAEAPNGIKKLAPLAIFYGSNTGTCQELSSRLAESAFQHGFNCTVKTINEATGNIPRDHPVLFITSTQYNAPPAPPQQDNASLFIDWLKSAHESALKGVDYAVFGCGSCGWKETYLHAAILLDSPMKQKQARPVSPRGIADASDGDILGDFDAWQSRDLWLGIARVCGSTTTKAVITNTPIRNQVRAQVNKISLLAGANDHQKYHMEIVLPEGTTFDIGDYLEVYPQNSQKDVDTVTEIFGKKEVKASITWICERFELNQPAGLKEHIHALAQMCLEEKLRPHLEMIVAKLAKHSGRRPSILQLLKAYPIISFPIEKPITMLPPIRPRLYSISSSPLASPTLYAITWSLLTHPASSTLGCVTSTPGLVSHYLAGLKTGDNLICSVRHGRPIFSPPSDSSSTPVIIFCVGSGLAPFRAFVQYQAEQARRDSSLSLAPAMLFKECRGPESRLYASELRGGRKVGLSIYGTLIHVPPLVQMFLGRVQDRVGADRDHIAHMWNKGARIYVYRGTQ